MKYLPVLLGLTLGVAGSLSAQTANDSVRPGTVHTGADKAREDARIARALKNGQPVYYITSHTPTGSLLPEVVRRYQGSYSSLSVVSHGSTYGTYDIGLTGSLNVGGALTTIDPAISSAGR